MCRLRLEKPAESWSGDRLAGSKAGPTSSRSLGLYKSAIDFGSAGSFEEQRQGLNQIRAGLLDGHTFCLRYRSRDIAQHSRRLQCSMMAVRRSRVAAAVTKITNGVFIFAILAVSYPRRLPLISNAPSAPVRYAAGQLHNLCECGGPLWSVTIWKGRRRAGTATGSRNGPSSMWRYAPVLPVSKPAAIVSLGEGMTPLIHTKRLGSRLGASDVWVKDEGINPTGSFKARGLSCAISMCVELGVKRVAYPHRLANSGRWHYAVSAIEAHIFMPRDSASQLHRMLCGEGEGHAGRRLNQRLRQDGRRRVRMRGRFKPEISRLRALPHRGQEDHGLQRPSSLLDSARCDFLSVRRWCSRQPIDVEGIRGDGADGLIGPSAPR